MNWEAIGALGEVIGALTVLLTLAYLAAQIRQSTRATRAATYSATTAGWHDYLQSQSVEDLDLFASLATKQEELTASEFPRGYYLCRVMFRRMEHDYYQYRAGTFESGTWDAYVASFQNDTFINPGIRVMWALQSDYLDPQFRSYLQPVVDRAAACPPPHTRRKFAELLKVEVGSK